MTDGTAVLGLGDIGPSAAMPVMEGKAVLFKEFAGVDAFPICLDTKDPDEIVRIVKALAPVFAGINLEDISAPRCFEIEERLKSELSIPVFHDDQHGTAVVVLAALINALKLVGKKIDEIKVVVAGVGAAGRACSKILKNAGVRNMIGVDRLGAIYKGRDGGDAGKTEWYVENTNFDREEEHWKKCWRAQICSWRGLGRTGTARVAKENESRPHCLCASQPHAGSYAGKTAPYVAVMATGRSDYPNQINNVLCFPGIFRGAIDCRATDINEEMKLSGRQRHRVGDFPG